LRSPVTPLRPSPQGVVHLLGALSPSPVTFPGIPAPARSRPWPPPPQGVSVERDSARCAGGETARAGFQNPGHLRRAV
jgi:hypothetical protein